MRLFKMKLKHQNDILYVHAKGLHEVEVAFGLQIESVEEFIDPIVIWASKANTVKSLSEYKGNE